MTRRLMLKINELGVPVGTELLDLFVPQYIDYQLSWVLIVARIIQLRRRTGRWSAASRLRWASRTALVSNIKLAVDAIVSAGKPHTFLGITDEGSGRCLLRREGIFDGHVICAVVLWGSNYAAEHVQETLGPRADAQGHGGPGRGLLAPQQQLPVRKAARRLARRRGAAGGRKQTR